MIESHSDLLYQYYIFTKKFEEFGSEIVAETERSSGKKGLFFGKVSLVQSISKIKLVK